MSALELLIHGLDGSHLTVIFRSLNLLALAPVRELALYHLFVKTRFYGGFALEVLAKLLLGAISVSRVECMILDYLSLGVADLNLLFQLIPMRKIS